MGQYHYVLNVDKKEFVHAHDIENDLKLMEQVGHLRSTSTALFLLLSNSNGRGGGDAPHHVMVGRWAGDRIVVQGDYAKPDDQGYVEFKFGDDWTNISMGVAHMLSKL